MLTEGTEDRSLIGYPPFASTGRIVVERFGGTQRMGHPRSCGRTKKRVGFVRGMSRFAIDSGEEKSYTPVAPQGVNGKKIFEK